MAEVTDITDFLPIYPNIEETPYPLFNPYASENLSLSLYRKNEFYEDRLTVTESVPSQPGQLTKHQQLVSRFFSSYTLYDSLILFHEMGCLDPNTMIPLYDGRFKAAKDIQLGDTLISGVGTPTKVIQTTSGTDEMYCVTQINGETYTINSEHVLALRAPSNLEVVWLKHTNCWAFHWFNTKTMRFELRTTTTSTPDASPTARTPAENKQDVLALRNKILATIPNAHTVYLTVKEYMQLAEADRNRLYGFKCDLIQWPEQQTSITPLILGMWLQQHNRVNQSFICMHESLLAVWREYGVLKGYGALRAIDDFEYVFENNDQFVSDLSQYRLLDDVRIPKEFIFTSAKCRANLLVGLLQADGYLDDKYAEMVFLSEKLTNQIMYVAKSLGLDCKKLGMVKYSIRYFKLVIRGDLYGVLYEGKQAAQSIDPHEIKVTPVGKGPYVGWTLSEESQTFLLNDFTVTHNSGKSCAAIGAIENLLAEKYGFRRALYISRNEELVDNFTNELVFRCTDGRYIPENYNDLSDMEKTIRKNKLIGRFYDTSTYETFASAISKLSDETIRERYRNYIIVLDEIQNVRPQEKSTKVDMYQAFHRFLHVVENAKILLMTGTLMTDGVEELASSLNLILPLDQQLPMGADFIARYFVRDPQHPRELMVRTDREDELKSYIAGRVSYVKAMRSQDVVKQFVGAPIGSLRHFNVLQSQMSQLQTESYTRAYLEDTSSSAATGVFQAARKKIGRKGGGVASFYQNSLEASLFVYPDGSWGTNGFRKYIQSTTRLTGKKRTKGFALSKELRSALVAPTEDGMLANIRRYSSKYADSISTILRAREQGQKVFVYNRIVHGSGLILFTLLLELFGFSRANGTEKEPRLRYASLLDISTTSKQVRRIIDRFNQPDNVHGDMITVILGSKKISEGVSFTDIQIEDIHVPWFNYAKLEQAIARGLRLGSHRLLLAERRAQGDTQPLQVDIYQRVVIPARSAVVDYTADTMSADLLLYEMSEYKDIGIKRLERVIKEAAIDCAETYKRNFIPNGEPFSRDCDYQESCAYTCDGVPSALVQRGLRPGEIDYSTYDLYYAQKSIRIITDILSEGFRTQFMVDLDGIFDSVASQTMQQLGRGLTMFVLLTALRSMIDRNVPIIDRYGFVGYLREHHDKYFLVNSLSVKSMALSEYYTKYPHTQLRTSFDAVLEPLFEAEMPRLIRRLFTSRTIDEVRQRMEPFSLAMKEVLLENALLAALLGRETNVEARDLVLSFFQHAYTQLSDGVWVSKLLLDTQGITRCLGLEGVPEDTWVDCTEAYTTAIRGENQAAQAQLRNNPYGYYGIVNPDSQAFCIRDVTKAQSDKFNKQTSGKVCTSWTKPELTELALATLQIPLPVSGLPTNRAALLAQIGKLRLTHPLSGNETDEELRRIIFWNRLKSKGPMCEYLKNWFSEQNLLEENRNCGTYNKRRKVNDL